MAANNHEETRMSDATGLGKLVPGFDFLQSLVKNAGSALPGIGQWVAPTLDPAELEKRIGELRTVQYWLEQNARMLATTIQALEVQRMTLSTLKSMNVQMNDLAESLKIKPARVQPTPAVPAKKAAPSEKPAPAVDPMQWWGALTNQFAQIATSAMKESATDAAKALTGGIAKQSFDAAGLAMKKVAGAPGRVVADVAGRAAQAAEHASAATKRSQAKPAAKKKKKQAGDSAAA
jgi:hypothetical protein